MKEKVLLIGWDAADWKIINPLLDAGEMPALERLVNNGVIGNIATIDPPVSPMLWTSISTGKRADKHGILGFIEPDIKSGGVKPVNVTSRKVKALWNILHHEGKRCNVIGWWPSHPAEPINGVMVSNFFHKTELRGALSRQITRKTSEGEVHPWEMKRALSELKVNPSEITEAHIIPFVPGLAKVDQAKDKHPAVIAKFIAEAATTQAAATYLLKNTQWDFTAVYFDMIDHFCHAFMKFYPPRMKGITEEMFEVYKDVIPAAYKFQDMMLERLLELAGDDTTIIIVSDHGFHTGRLRPLSLPQLPAAPVLEHSPYGIICISGKGIKKDERVYGATLLDITPTILTLFGLPAGKDMDGKVLTSIFQSPSSIQHSAFNTQHFIDSWEDIDGDFGTHASGMQENSYETAEAMNQLMELGYIEDPGEDKKKAAESAVNEANYNLARVYIGSRKYEKASGLLRNLFDKNKWDIRYNLDLANCYLNLNKIAEAKGIIDNLRGLDISDQLPVDSNQLPDARNNLRFLPNIDLLEGLLLIRQKKYKKGLELLKKAEKTNPHLPNIHLEIGKLYLQLNQYLDAKRAFKKALDIDDSQAGGWHGLSVCELRMRNYEQAADSALTAIGLLYHFPGAHYHLGEALYMLGRHDEASKAFEVCLKIAPDFLKAKQWLEKTGMRNYESGKNNDNRELIKPEKINITNPKSGIINPQSEIIIVSGIPRSGTSMMMRMLMAGGIEPLTDYERQPDNNNPNGYFEYNPVKSLSKDNTWLWKAQEKVLKVVAHQLYNLPMDYHYKVIFMKREMEEIIRSQQIMLGRNPEIFPIGVAESYKKELERVEIWAQKHPNVEIIYINYADILNKPDAEINKITDFIDIDVDSSKMIETINPLLYRNRR